MCSDGVLVGLEVPADMDFAVSADVLRVGGGDVAAGDGCNVDTLPAWLRGRESTDVCVDPVTD